MSSINEEHEVSTRFSRIRCEKRQTGEWEGDYGKALDLLEISSSKPNAKGVSITLQSKAHYYIAYPKDGSWDWDNNVDFLAIDLSLWFEQEKETILEFYYGYIRMKRMKSLKV